MTPSQPQQTRLQAPAQRRASSLRDERGMTIIEVLFSMVLLVIGLLAIFSTLEGSDNSVVAAERATVMTQVGQHALQAAQSIPYAELADSSSPVQTSTTNTRNPTYYLSGCVSGACSKYQWSTSNSADVETLAVNTTNGRQAPLTYSVVSPPGTTACSTVNTSSCQIAVAVYVFVTTSTASYKRVTVAVLNVSSGPPYAPIYVSTFVTNNAGGAADPLYGATSSTSPTNCLDGVTTVACSF